MKEIIEKLDQIIKRLDELERKIDGSVIRKKGWQPASSDDSWRQPDKENY